MVGYDSPAGTHFPSPSDLVSEGRKDLCLEGVRFRNLMDEGIGSKRSNSDITYAGHDEFDKFHSVKIYGGGSSSEQTRRLNDEENFSGSKALLKTSTLSQADAYSAIWGRAVGMNVPGNLQCPSFISPFVRPVHPIAFRDAAAGPFVISQLPSDEGSRNGKNESGVWNLMKSSTVSDKSNTKSRVHVSELSGNFVSGKKLKTGALLQEPESPILGRQMTILYDGHAYVFDDVHPYKAEVIMTMAGSNATFFSSAFAAKANTIQIKQGSKSAPIGEIENGTASKNTDLTRNQRGKPATNANSSIHEFRSSDQISILPGDDQDSKGVVI